MSQIEREKMAKVQVKEQNIKLPINNIEIKNETKDTCHKHSTLLPNSIRSIICGLSNCGKTNVIISLLGNQNGLHFENVYVYAKSLYQPTYVHLKRMLSGIKGVGIYMFSSNDSVIPLEEAKPNSIFIFDDVICDKQDNIRSHFCMERYKGVDCFYLTQSYAHIPKHLIRENANLLALFKQDVMRLKHTFNDYGVSIYMPFDAFKALYVECWREKYGFLVLDTERAINNGKYRIKFDKFISIS